MVELEKPQVATPEAGPEDAPDAELRDQPSALAETVVQHAAEPSVAQAPSAEAKKPEAPGPTAEEYAQVRARASQAEQREARQALEQTVKAQQQWDEGEAAKDATAIDDGLMTKEQAQFGKALRQRLIQTYWAVQQEEARLAEVRNAVAALHTAAEPKALIHMAHLIAEEHGIAFGSPEFKELLTTKTQQAMEKKAMQVQLKKAKEQARAAGLTPETYDQGPGAGALGPDVDRLSPQDKIRRGLALPRKS